MTRSGARCALFAAVLSLAGCAKNQKLGTVAVDLYIHPEAGSSDDLMLQTAIRRNLDADPLLANVVHARVLERQVVLSGTVAKDELRQKAEQVATATRVTVNDSQAIVPAGVKNLLRVEK